MAEIQLTNLEEAQLADLVKLYQERLDVYEGFSKQLLAILQTKRLADLYHSLRWRVKAPSHLLDKLQRKMKDAKKTGVAFDITKENLFDKITDLVGFRILHLHTTQFEAIDKVLKELLAEERYPIAEGPTAKTWDLEYKEYFKRIGVDTEDNKRMYTSVHYIIEGNSATKRTAEIQVRTLAEELWGEVDHTINYPHLSTKLSCREQILVLARVTSSCTRLVDSIFKTHHEILEVQAPSLELAPRDLDSKHSPKKKVDVRGQKSRSVTGRKGKRKSRP